jgi:lipopolysaccharide biosynthesis glycosyltransferase
MSSFAYYIGVDHREPEALRVCEASARAYASKPINVKYLEHIDLRRRQLFDRPWRTNEDGTYTDERDGRPFSVQFSHSRFLTPILAKYDGITDWALFTDCDLLILDDIWKLLKEADSSKTVMVVPHNFNPTATVKMDGQVQSLYNRKLWSSVMLWNLKSNKLPTVEMVNMASGNYLHTFEWLQNSDIGFLSESWNWIPRYSPTTDFGCQREAANKPLPISAIHFTMGAPLENMTNREPTPFDDLWRAQLKSAYQEYTDFLPNG